MQLKITKASELKPLPDNSNLGFGHIFTDHMFNMDYDPENGWNNPRIEPYAPIEMDPASIVLHYGQTVFEGMKAYKTDSGDIHFFRPKDNFKRLNRSCRILCIPEFDENSVLDYMKQLINLEKNWIPGEPGTSLYIRPTIIGMDPFLGVRASNTYRFFIILSPVGAYYAEGFNPVKIWVTKNHVRAVRGGIGEAKTAGNYAASLCAGEEAYKKGYTQVLWLDGVHQKYIEEVGSMNIFFVIDNELITPKLNGSILPGITRDSLIGLAKKWGITVKEKLITIDELMDAYASEKLQEVFGSGTAAVISPVGEMKYGDKVVKIGNGKVGPLAEKFYKAINNIQYGKAEDSMGWIEKL
jgi:branched-chain amino acid aminotransferase